MNTARQNAETFIETQRRRRRQDRNTVIVTVLVLLGVLASILLAGGCGRRATAPVVGPLTIEQFARGVREELVTFIRQAQKNHPECSADKPTAKLGICPAIHKAIDVSNRTGAIINVYCSGTSALGAPAYQAGGPCAPVAAIKPQLQAILSEALLLLAQYNQQPTISEACKGFTFGRYRIPNPPNHLHIQCMDGLGNVRLTIYVAGEKSIEFYQRPDQLYPYTRSVSSVPLWQKVGP